MPILISCPICFHDYTVAESMIGKTSICPSCGVRHRAKIPTAPVPAPALAAVPEEEMETVQGFVLEEMVEMEEAAPAALDVEMPAEMQFDREPPPREVEPEPAALEVADEALMLEPAVENEESPTALETVEDSSAEVAAEMPVLEAVEESAGTDVLEVIAESASIEVIEETAVLEVIEEPEAAQAAKPAAPAIAPAAPVPTPFAPQPSVAAVPPLAAPLVGQTPISPPAARPTPPAVPVAAQTPTIPPAAQPAPPAYVQKPVVPPPAAAPVAQMPIAPSVEQKPAAPRVDDLGPVAGEAKDLQEFEKLLSKRQASSASAFWLTSGSDEYPTLGLFVQGDLAYLYFAPGEGEAGLCSRRALGDKLPGGKTTFRTGSDGAEMQVLNQFVVAWSEALSAARDFFATKSLPRSIQWFCPRIL